MQQMYEIISLVTGLYHVYETWGFWENLSPGWGISALFSRPSSTG